LLNQASDDRLRGVLAHEIAHEDLGHPAKAQVVGVGVGVGAALLEKFFPGSAAIAPIAGTLISNSYSRPLEFEADRHAVTLLKRAGYSKAAMIDTLSWLMRRNGDSGGGFLASHPATSDRIKALQSVRYYYSIDFLQSEAPAKCRFGGLSSHEASFQPLCPTGNFSPLTNLFTEPRGGRNYLNP
jgi:predicted Zn-dependent protease